MKARDLIAAIAVWLMASWAFAAEPAQKPQSPAPAAKQEPEAEAAKGEETAAADAESKTAADKAGDKSGEKAAAGKGSPQRFIPSEQVRADFDVSFPIDI